MHNIFTTLVVLSINIKYVFYMGLYDLKNQLSENMNLLKRLIEKPKNVIEDYLMQNGFHIIDNSREYKREQIR